MFSLKPNTRTTDGNNINDDSWPLEPENSSVFLVVVPKLENNFPDYHENERN